MSLIHVITGALYLLSSPDSLPELPPAEEVVSRLCSLTHGLLERTMDDETRELVATIKDHPEHYAAAVADRLTIPTDGRLDQGRLQELKVALSLAEIVGRQHVGPAVESFFDSVVRAETMLQASDEQSSDAEDGQRVLVRCRFLENRTLAVLQTFNDPHAVSWSVNHICVAERGEPVNVALLDYLGALAPQILDSHRELLRQAYQGATSPYGKNRVLKKILETPKANPAESQISLPRGSGDVGSNGIEGESR